MTPTDPRTATILDVIGDTPLVRVDDIWVKLEFLNPSGSIKARLAKYMIERAEREGLLRPGDTIVEASSGNTGNAMSMVAAVKGYRMLVVMPNGMSPERVAISRAFGAEVHTSATSTSTTPWPRRASSGPSRASSRRSSSTTSGTSTRTARGSVARSSDQLPAGVVPDALLAGVGTGGTLIGVGHALREVNPALRIVGVEPNESCTLMCGEVGRHLIEGIADGFVPGIFERHRDLVDDLVSVDSESCIAEMRRLAREHGMFVGPSSGANLVAARVYRETHPELTEHRHVLLRRGREVPERLLHRHLTSAARGSLRRWSHWTRPRVSGG